MDTVRALPSALFPPDMSIDSATAKSLDIRSIDFRSPNARLNMSSPLLCFHYRRYWPYNQHSLYLCCCHRLLLNPLLSRGRLPLAIPYISDPHFHPLSSR